MQEVYWGRGVGRVKGCVEWGHERSRQTDRENRETEKNRDKKGKKQERQRQGKQKSELCLAGTFKGYIRPMADGGTAPGDRQVMTSMPRWQRQTAAPARPYRTQGCHRLSHLTMWKHPCP